MKRTLLFGEVYNEIKYGILSNVASVHTDNSYIFVYNLYSFISYDMGTFHMGVSYQQ